LSEEEKSFLKQAKKIREIWKLDERVKAGEKLEPKQLEKVHTLPDCIKELIAMVAKLPEHSEVVEKNPDMAALVPNSALRDAERRRQQEAQRRERIEAEERRKKEIVVAQSRHERPITDIAVSADGRYIFTSSKDKMVLCWSTRDKLLEVVRTYGGHEGAVWAVDVSAQAPPRLATGAADGRVYLWPSEGRAGDHGNTVVKPDGKLDHGGIVKVLRWCQFDPAKFVVASDKIGTQPPLITVWEAGPPGKGAESVCVIKELPSKVNDVQWGAGAITKVFSAHDNGYLGVWDASNARLLKTLKLHPDPVMALSLATDGVTLVSASRDMTAKAVDVSVKEMPVLRTWKTDRPLNAVAVSPEFKGKETGPRGAVVLGGGRQDRDITTTKECAEGEMEAQIYSSDGDWWGSGKGHIGPIHVIRFVSAETFATGSEDGCVYVHDLYGKLVHTDNTRDNSR